MGDPNNARIAVVLKCIGRVHQEQGDYRSAFDKYTTALCMLCANGDQAADLIIAETLHNLGRICLLHRKKLRSGTTLPD
jgi:hypothetical protein